MVSSNTSHIFKCAGSVAKSDMTSSPTVSQTILDKFITRKGMRENTLRRLRARERLEPKGYRQRAYNVALEAAAEAPLEKFLLKEHLSNAAKPDHIALIPDGNRRWSKARNRSVGEGYYQGSLKLEDFRKWAMVDNGADYATCFTLSTENIERRPVDELKQLYAVFTKFFNRVPDTQSVHENEIKHEVRGNPEAMDKLPSDVKEAIANMEEATSDYDNKKIIFLMPYGGRDEIINAAKKTDSPLVEGTNTISETGEDESNFRSGLMLGDLPDVDLMMRTSEVRLSNFMLYHNAYAEFTFFQKNWPSFTETDFYEAMYKYANRDRRFGV